MWLSFLRVAAFSLFMLSILDAIGPFFVNQKTDGTTNWSKIPFEELETDGVLDPVKTEQALANFRLFLERTAHLGNSAISIDDLAHLTDFDFYPKSLRTKLAQYREFYDRIFALAQEFGKDVFVTTDIMFTNSHSHARTRGDFTKTTTLFCKALEQLFSHFPVSGVIVRIGEADGIDVVGDFKSRLFLKSPKQANRFLKQILPVFEHRERQLIFRTWTVGAHPIGDLIWNRTTYDRVFGDIESEQLIVSMKYGESDFYWFSDNKLNPLFSRGKHKKMLELQTRREREGFGMHPYFVGWEYQTYLQQARQISEFVGYTVWCQTGGWSMRRDLTYLTDSSRWNELNTFATFALIHQTHSPEAAIREFFHGKKAMVGFVRLFTTTLQETLYGDGFPEKTLYFRRFRIPPLLWLFWDHITINPFFVFWHRLFADDQIPLPLAKIEQISALGKKLRVPDLDFQVASLRMFVSCRQLLAGIASTKQLQQIARFEQRFPDTYRFSISPGLRTSLSDARLLKLVFACLIRTKARYRAIDHLFLSRRFSAMLYACLFPFIRKKIPSFVNGQAMDIKTILVD